MITRFQVKNYKALRDVSLELTPVHALIGPNDSGKTSILEAIEALSRSTESLLIESFPRPWQGAQLVWQKDANLNVVLRAEFSAEPDAPSSYELQCRFEANQPIARVRSEKLETPGQGSAKLEFNDTTTGLCRARNGEAHLRDTKVQRVLKTLEGARVNRWSPKLLALPVKVSNDPTFTIQSNGFGLAQCIEDVLHAERARFDELEQRFGQLFPGLKFELRRCPGYAYSENQQGLPALSLQDNSAGRGLFFRLSGSSQEIPASSASDGVLLALGYLTLLHMPRPRRTLLIEEPENGVHPRRLEQIVDILREMVITHSGTQVLLTTHSPYVLDLLKPDEVTLCSRQKDGSVSTRRLSDSQAVKDNLDVFTLGEIWTNVGEEKLAADTADSNVK